jgi:DegV family protein with EDD domain
MANARIVTDVTADLEPEVIDRLKIEVLPVEILLGSERYRLQRNDSWQPLFRRMTGAPARAAQATIPGTEFQQVFARLNRKTEEILVLLSSGKLSDAYQQARAAARAFLGRCRIVVLDSMSASWGLRLMVQAAAEAADQGRSLDEIVRLVRGLLPHVYLVFFVERLDYLEQGGRLGPAQALLGTMLQIKPLLLVEDGEIVSMEKVRTRLQAVEKLVDFVAEFARVQKVVILHSPVDNEINNLVPELRSQLDLALPGKEFETIEYDPVLACHLGPEALGVVVYEGA